MHTNNLTVRLINPAKNDIERISKVILDKINASLIRQLKVNQWKNTQNVIEWFMNIEEKSKYRFIVFDIKDFYPSIKETLLIKAINFAEKLVHITNEDKVIIKHARKSLLYDNSEPWMKKDSGLFDVTMGAYDGAEVCQLVGTFLLYKLSLKYNKNKIGLYRDDGLAIFKNISGPKSERIKKNIRKLFKENQLDIVIQCNMKTVNHLDVTLNLENSTYRPYKKENNQIKHINIESNHPPSIIKQLPLSIESLLSSLSSSEEIFSDSIIPYQDALDKSGYKHKLKYKANIDTVSNKKQRKRNIIWFNPTYSKNVKTNIGKISLNLTKKHFPPHHKFHKLFNKNTVKISYGCTRNIKSIINSHNARFYSLKRVLNKEHAIA